MKVWFRNAAAPMPLALLLSARGLAQDGADSPPPDATAAKSLGGSADQAYTFLPDTRLLDGRERPSPLQRLD